MFRIRIMYWNEISAQIWSTDEYWYEDKSAQEATFRTMDRFNKGFPDDFVANFNERRWPGRRDPSPKFCGHWARQ